MSELFLISIQRINSRVTHKLVNAFTLEANEPND
jgi:hypothetical protein